MNVRLVLEPHAPEALKDVVREGLARYNVAATGAAESYPVCLFLKNEHQEVLGGLLGHIWAQYQHIAILRVARSSAIRATGPLCCRLPSNWQSSGVYPRDPRDVQFSGSRILCEAWVRDHRGVARLSTGSSEVFSQESLPMQSGCVREDGVSNEQLFYDDGL